MDPLDMVGAECSTMETQSSLNKKESGWEVLLDLQTHTLKNNNQSKTLAFVGQGLAST